MKIVNRKKKFTEKEKVRKMGNGEVKMLREKREKNGKEETQMKKKDT